MSSPYKGDAKTVRGSALEKGKSGGEQKNSFFLPSGRKFQIRYKIAPELCAIKRKQLSNQKKKKNMKKLMILLAGLFLCSAPVAYADNDKPITVDQLPEKAQQFLRQHFPNEKVSLAKSERDFLELTYEVIFTNGMKVEFTKDGQWKDVDCRYASVPKGIVPAQIAQKAQELYPETTIRQIDRDSRDYEVKLSNGLELTFDLKFNLIDIDD